MSHLLCASRVRYLLTLVVAVFSGACLSAEPVRDVDADWGGEGQPLLDQLTLFAPSGPGGGLRMTAQAMKQALEGERLVRSVTIVSSPGAGGLIGLAQFLGSQHGDGHSLLVGGTVMLGAAVRNNAQVSLLDTVPLARLTTDFAVLVVPADSQYRKLGDLLEAMQTDPGALHWAGGSAGGPDEIVVWHLALVAGADPRSIHYVSFTTGADVGSAVAAGKYPAGVSGYSELLPLLTSGKLHALAIAAPTRLHGVDIPTFEELGIASNSFVNWRGVFAPPDVTPNDLARLNAVIQRMVASPRWQALVQQHRWNDRYVPSDKFGEFVRSERRRLVRSEPFVPGLVDVRRLPSGRERRMMWTMVAAGTAVVLLLVIVVQRLSSRKREEALRRDLERATAGTSKPDAPAGAAPAAPPADMHAQIEQEFDRWQLTGAERAIAHLMLKGLRLKDIANIRNTSERTVRQQAQVIYRKAGLEGRTDLAAYFLGEDAGGDGARRRSAGSDV